MKEGGGDLLLLLYVNVIGKKLKLCEALSLW
jgi:hypothetical protein